MKSQDFLFPFLAVICILEPALMGAALARTKAPSQDRVAAVQDATQANGLVLRSRNGLILRQDLVDRSNPNNIRTDWPAPSGQPGGSH